MHLAVRGRYYIEAELPRGLAEDLRSWRGTSSRKNEPLDLEKGVGDLGEKDVDERALSPDNSVVLHPTASSHALRHKTPQLPPDVHSLPHDGAQRDHSRLPAQTSPQQLPHEAPAAATTPHPPHPHPTPSRRPPPAGARITAHEDALLHPTAFYDLLGMRAPVSTSQAPQDLARRHGLYSHVHHRFTTIQNKYRAFDTAAYVALALQRGLHRPRQPGRSGLARRDCGVWGAVSTVVGGLLAVMKGQGPPSRLLQQQQRDALRSVLFEAEELYWDGCGGEGGVFWGCGEGEGGLFEGCGGGEAESS
ncbi:hypothetical protein EJ03DRAFT_329101 [Teratosphaeria nubilosa]|uniref:SMODS and SLOG-associating 2TM effector domain-containing protein n=1 Tax=Teratosphaeria nubilosa TaxID=161662 RepID=A0A6G1L4I6_9PEZI|nr:hypothetical protein EJ03DRAFT_329101 [Teratosphaeria nubilosa]